VFTVRHLISGVLDASFVQGIEDVGDVAAVDVVFAGVDDVRALERELDRRGLHVPFLENDLIAEMHGE